MGEFYRTDQAESITKKGSQSYGNESGLDAAEFRCACCRSECQVMISPVHLWYVGKQFGHRVCPTFLYCIRSLSVYGVLCVCVSCVHISASLNSRFAGYMWEQRESTWLRGESQMQVIALTFNSNEEPGKIMVPTGISRHAHTHTATCK